MRILWEIFTVLIGLGVVFALAKGFPQFGQVLRVLIFNPIGLICVAGLILAMVFLRKRTAQRHTDSQR